MRFVCEPQRKVHLNEELVAQTMSELYISHPRPKVARRSAADTFIQSLIAIFYLTSGTSELMWQRR